MNKKVVHAAVMLVALCCLVFSCKKHSSENSENSDGWWGDTESSNESSNDSFIYPGNFFDLDYTEYTPEEELPSGKVSLATPSASGKKAESVVPGLRKISDYKTKYSTKRQSEDAQVVNAPEKADAADIKTSPDKFVV